MTSTESLRREMVERQVAARGVRDTRTLEAMREVPREVFVPDDLAGAAYDDAPLPIAEGQTISQPFVVALMIESLRTGPGDRALEIGAGSGYAAAVLGQITGEVHAIERFETLAGLARERMGLLGYDNVWVHCADGTRGWPDRAPYDVILVSAGGTDVPRNLMDQLAVGGRLVIPVGPEARSQQLLRITRNGGRRYRREALGRVMFVPLVEREA